jgi:cysteine desulfurase
MRSGTLNVPGIVGLGKAVQLCGLEMDAEARRLRELRDNLWTGLQAELDDIEPNGHPSLRLPHNLSVIVLGVESRSLLVQLKHKVALSTGSACTTARVEPSHVILALGFGEERAHSSLRLGLGRGTVQTDINYTVQQICGAVEQTKRLTSA